ncbi:hypothetical protein ACFE04_008342 [Oxalis oulophora]
MRSVNFIRFIVIAVVMVTSSISLLGAAPLQQPQSEDSQQQMEPIQEIQVTLMINDEVISLSRTGANIFRRDSMAAVFLSRDRETSMSVGLLGLAISPRIGPSETVTSRVFDFLAVIPGAFDIDTFADVQTENLGRPLPITAIKLAFTSAGTLFFGLTEPPFSLNSNYTFTVDVQTENLGVPHPITAIKAEVTSAGLWYYSISNRNDLRA